jgi:hypothetical protein
MEIKMKTVVDIIKECLDKGITSEYDIAIDLREAFPTADYYVMKKRIKPTIAYLTKKSLPKCEEFAICGTPQKSEQQEMLIKALKIAKEKTDLKIVKFVWRRGGHSYFRPERTYMNGEHISGNYIKISKNDYRSKDWTLLFGTVLHELVHASGFWGHGPKFYTKLIDAGVKCDLDLDKWFTTEYGCGKRFYAEYKRTKHLDLSICIPNRYTRVDKI